MFAGWVLYSFRFNVGGGQTEKDEFDSIRQSYLDLIPFVKKLNMFCTIA